MVRQRSCEELRFLSSLVLPFICFGVLTCGVVAQEDGVQLFEYREKLKKDVNQLKVTQPRSLPTVCHVQNIGTVLSSTHQYDLCGVAQGRMGGAVY